MNGLTFKKIFEEKYPLNLAYSWDNVGLQVGTLNKELTGIVLALDLTTEVLDEAINLGANLVLVHHPVIFSPVKRIVLDDYQGALLSKAIKNDIAVYVAHTNFDISNFGMNKILADQLCLTNQEILDYTTEEEGLGRIGFIKEQPLSEFIKTVKSTFNLQTVSLIGDLNKTVKKIAISGGSGGSMLTHPKLAGVDLFLTGDVSYHHALDALNNGLTVLDIGHNIEKFGLIDLQKQLKKDIDLPIDISKINTNPYQNI